MRPSLVEMAKVFYRDEINDHLTYKALAEKLSDERLRRGIARIADIELKHANFWKGLLEARRKPLPQLREHKARLVLLRLLQRCINPVLLVGLLELSEMSGVKRYFDLFKTAALDEPDKTHLQSVIVDELEHEMFFKQTAHALGVAHLRDFVLGMNRHYRV